jgi:hypothetical protein
MRPTAITYGIVAGLLAVTVQVFFGVRPPPAYGICVACHARDVVNWTTNHLLGTNWEVAPVSVITPVLTTIGLLVGASLAARRNREYRPVALGQHWRSLVLGALAITGALIAAGCPTRLVLLSAYGDILGLIAVVSVAIGIVAGTWLLRRGLVS